MKPWLRYFLGAAVALFATTAVHAASNLRVSAASVVYDTLPGHTATFTITATNTAPAGVPVNSNDFVAGNASFDITLTNHGSGYFFDVIANNVPANGTIAESNGTGTFVFSATIPAQVTEAGSYDASVAITAVSSGTRVGAPFGATGLLSVTGKPNFIITGLTYPSGTSFVGGNQIPMTVTWINQPSTNGIPNVPWRSGTNGFSSFYRIKVVLSTNPTFGDADDFQLTIQDFAAKVNADGSVQTYSWTQILPSNYVGSYYVLAKIDALDAVDENDNPTLTVNGDNVWGSNAVNPSGTLINLIPSTSPTVYLASHTWTDQIPPHVPFAVAPSATGYSDNPSMSSDSRFMAFASDAPDLIATEPVPLDNNGVRDIFLFDSQTREIRRISVSQQGIQANGASNTPAISADGHYVAFASDAGNLVLDDNNGFTDIFVVNTLSGLIARVSMSSSTLASPTARQADNPSFRPAISQTGRYVVFQSTATNLVSPSTTPGVSHIYWHDRDVGNTGNFDTIGNTATAIMDVTPGGAAGNGNSIQAAISADGSTVAFTSDATNLVAGDVNGHRDVFVRNVAGATTKLVSVANTTAAQGDGDSQTPSLSSDGHYVAFASLATNLVAGDTNAVSDIFVYDTTAPVGTPVVRRMSVSSAGAQGTDPSPVGPPDQRLGSINPTISADGRYVAFASLDDNLTTGDINGQAQPNDSNKAIDVFVHDRDAAATGTFDTPGNILTQMVSVNQFGYQTNGLLGSPSTAASDIYPVISANGRFVAFPSDAEGTAGLAYAATNELPLDTNNRRDVFLFDRRTNALPNPTTPPTVTITNPGSGGTALVNSPISITASATTTIGVVSSVQFFVNGISLGTSTVFPYSQTWTPTAVGNYNLSALVTDSFGNLGVSTNVAVTINAAPSVGLTAPAGGSAINVGAVTTVAATAAASNPGAFINTVQFFANGQSLGTVTAPPSSVSFSPTVSWSPASTGTFVLTAVAIDSIGTVTTSPSVSVSVITPGGGGGGGGGALSPPPTVSLLPAPPAGAAVNIPITLTSTATAAVGFTVVSVQYFANGVSLGSGASFPYAVTWVPLALGNYSITAVATDNVGTTTTSAAATVIVSSGTAPTVSLTSPNTGTIYALGSPISLSAVTNLGSGLISSVNFLANNVSIKPIAVPPVGQGAVPFFNTIFTPVASGTYVFTAVVVDTSGNQTISPSVTVTVRAIAPPVVAVTSPTTGSVLTTNVTTTLTASAVAGTGASISGVEFFANGLSLGADSTFPYSVDWTPTAPGTYTLTVVATDTFGSQTTSSGVKVNVGAGSSTLPFVYLTSPPTGTSVTANTSVFVSANAGDPDGTVTNVQFYANGNLIGSKNSLPYFALWTPTTAGTYSITAVVTDDAGNRVTSTASTITSLVQVGVVPVAGITFNNPTVDTPTAGAAPAAATPFTPVKVDYGSKLIIAVPAVDQDGFVSNVQFFANGTNIGTISAAPYYTTYTLNTLSDVAITAIVTDNSGNAIYTDPILISTQPSDPTGDLVTLVSPLSGATYTVGGQILFSATHNFGTANPPKIDFYINGQQFTTVSAPTTSGGASAPYQFIIGLTRAGTYDVHAVLRLGNTTTISTPARITVTSNTAPTVSIRSPATNGSYVIGTPITIAADAASGTTTIQNVQFFVNGSALSTANTAPYNATWNPGAAGHYTITAAATDSAGNQTLSAPITVTFTGNAPPLVSLSTPSVGARVVAGSSVSLVAAASDVDGTVASVRFLANGVVVGTGTTAPYTTTWTPSAAGIYSVVAQATDSSGNVSSSGTVAVNVLVNQPPVVSLSSPTNGSVFRTGAAAGLSATATDPDGTISSVQFLANGNVVGSATSAPFNVFWTPGSAGAYTIVAQATDNTGNVASSTAANITVLANQSPVVSLTAPGNGAVVRAGSSATLTASATDSDGNIASVQFFANGVAVGSPITSLTSGGYRAQWTPAAAGIYTITATAIDNSGAASNATSTVLAIDASAGGGDSVYTGTFFGLNETGRFAVISINGNTAAFIGYSTASNKVYFYSGIPVDAAHGFTLTDSTGRTLISGTVNDTAATVTTLDGAPITLIGIVSFPSGASVASGFYTGSLAGRPASSLAAIVGPDASIMLFASDGTVRTAGAGTVNTTGAFTNIPALGGGTFTGKADPVTGFLSGNLTGPIAGGMMAAVESGVSFSDGFLRNLSSRGQVGTGTNVLVAGFVVGGTTPKQVLIRAIGPSLTQFAIAGALANPQLQLFGGAGGSALVASNDNWGGTTQIFNASGAVGAFALSPTSLDAVILTSLAPGNYTAQVSGVGGTTGVALVELYDVDNPTPYSAQKVINISTRAIVGTGQAQLIAGFVISGNTAKKVLVRAVGPTLGAPPFNLPGILADPYLRIIRNSDNLVVRENDNWETGNDISLVNAAATGAGAFPLASGSKDAAILISLPPGSYSAEVTGNGSTTGIALVEVYEVP